MGKRRLPALLAVLLLVAGLAACGDDDDTETGSGTGSASAPAEEGNELRIEADDYSFKGVTGPIDGGVVEVTLENVGEKNHEAAFLEIGDKSVEQALEDLSPAFEGEPFPDAPRVAGGISGVPGGETRSTTMLLPAGKYALMCALTDDESDDEEAADEDAGAATSNTEAAETTGTTAAGGGEGGEGEGAAPHFVLGMLQEVTVEGGEGAELPDTGASIKAEDWAFDVAGLEAGENEVVFTNTGNELHHFVLSVFEEGVTEAQAEDAFEKFMAADQEGGPPPEGAPEPEDVADTIPLDKGFGQTFELDLEANRVYLIMCFISDRAGGPPHAVAHDMVRTFTVE